MKSIICITIVLVSCLLPANCLGTSANFSSLITGYTKVTTKGSKTDTIKGTIYYQSLGTLIFVIHSPVTQWIVYQDKAIIYYYPNEKIAYRFKRAANVQSSSPQAFLGLAGDDLGLPGLGYTLRKKEIADKNLRLYWQPPKTMRDAVKEVILTLNDDHLSAIEIVDVNSKSLLTYQFSKYMTFKTKAFPMEIVTIKNTGTVPSREILTYQTPQFDVPLPASITGFHLPADVTVQECSG